MIKNWITFSRTGHLPSLVITYRTSHSTPGLFFFFCKLCIFLTPILSLKGYFFLITLKSTSFWILQSEKVFLNTRSSIRGKQVLIRVNLNTWDRWCRQRRIHWILCPVMISQQLAVASVGWWIERRIMLLRTLLVRCKEPSVYQTTQRTGTLGSGWISRQIRSLINCEFVAKELSWMRKPIDRHLGLGYSPNDMTTINPTWKKLV